MNHERARRLRLIENQAVSIEEIFALQGVPEMKNREKRYLPQPGFES